MTCPIFCGFFLLVVVFFDSSWNAMFNSLILFGFQKIDKMYSAFTGQPLEKVQQYTERDRFLSVSEVM